MPQPAIWPAAAPESDALKDFVSQKNVLVTIFFENFIFFGNAEQVKFLEVK